MVIEWNIKELFDGIWELQKDFVFLMLMTAVKVKTISNLRMDNKLRKKMHSLFKETKMENSIGLKKDIY